MSFLAQATAKACAPNGFLLALISLRSGDSPAVAAGIGEMCAVVGEHGVYLVGDGFEKV